MNIYTLIYEEISDDKCGSEVQLFTSMESAQQAMRGLYKEAVQRLHIDESVQTDLDNSQCGNEKAHIHTFADSYEWRIESQDIPVEIAVKVEGGLVQSIYSNAEVDAKVYDLDVSGYPDDDEYEDVRKRSVELVERITQPGWKEVW